MPLNEVSLIRLFEAALWRGGLSLCLVPLEQAPFQGRYHSMMTASIPKHSLWPALDPRGEPQAYVASADTPAVEIGISALGFKNAMAITPPTSATIPQTKKPWWYPSATETALSTALPMM
jgi:hypothetical protein